MDALPPEKGKAVRYGVRELQLDLRLQAVKVSNPRAGTLRAQVWEPVNAVGFRIRGMGSDAEDA